MPIPTTVEAAANVVPLARPGAAEDALAIIEDGPAGAAPLAGQRPWKVLIVDDEPEVHQATMFALSGLTVAGRRIEFLHAGSGAEARSVFASEKDIALVLLDVVMETDDAGLRLVRHIRNECRLADTRIVLRTGQPGYAPELQVIQE